MSLRRWAWAAALAAAALAIALLLAAAALLALSSGWQRERLRAALEAALASGLGAQVRIAALEGPLYPALTLRGVAVGDPAAPLLALERLALRLDAAPLLRTGRLEVESLEVEGPEYCLTRDGDGTWRGLGLDAPERPREADDAFAPAWPGGIDVRRFTVRRGRLHLRDASIADPLVAGVELELEGLELPWSDAASARLAGALRARLGPAQIAEGLRLESGALELTLAEGKLAIADGRVTGSFGALELAGGAELRGWLDRRLPAAAEISARFRQLDPALLTGRPELAGALAGEARAEIRLGAGAQPEDAELTLELETADASLALTALEGIALRARVARGAWVLDRLALEGEGLAISAAGEGTREVIGELQLDARAERIERFLPTEAGEPVLAGALELHGRLRGPFEAPSGEVDLTGRGLALRGFALGVLRAHLRGPGGGLVRVESLSLSEGALALRSEGVAVLRLGRDGVEIEGLQLKSGDQRLALEGRVGAETLSGVRAEATALDVGALARLAASPLALAGRVDARLRLDGPLERPRVSGRVHWSEPHIEDLALDALVAEAETEGQLLRVEASGQAAGRQILHVSGQLPYDDGPFTAERILASPRARAELRGEEIDLRLLQPFLGRDVRELRGRVGLALDFQGGPTPRAQGRLDLAEGEIELAALGRRVGPVEGGLRVAPHEKGIEIEELDLRVEGQQLVGRGVLVSDGFRDLHLEAPGLDLAALAAWLPRAPSLGGVARVELQLDGPFERPALRGDVTWESPRVGQVELERASASLSSTEAQGLRAVVQMRRDGRELLRADAELPYAAPLPSLADLVADRTTRVQLRGRGVDLRILEPFLPRALRDLQGRVDLAAELRGGETAPKISGWVDLAEGSVSVPLTRQTYAPIRGRLVLADDALALEAFSIGPPEAGAQLAGRVELAGLEPREVQLRLDLQRFPLSRSPLLSADAGGSVQIRGPLDALVVEGGLELGQASISLRETADPALREIRVLADGGAAGEDEIRESGPAAPGILDRARVDFRLSAPRNTWIRGRGTELEIEGDLQLRKQPLEALTLAGTARVVRGRYTFYVKRFEVETGNVTFDGGTTIDPLLEIEAVHRVRDVRILLYVSGRYSNPVLRLASEPPMSDADVLAYLLAGRPADQLAGSGQDAGLESAAAALAAGVAAQEIAALLPGIVPIDTLDVRISESGVPSEIQIGKYLTDRVFVRYGHVLGPEPQDQVRVEFRLDEHWSLETDLSSTQSAGADVIWSLDY